MKNPSEVMHEAIDILYELIDYVNNNKGNCKGETRELEGGYYFEVDIKNMIFLRKHDTNMRFGNAFGDCMPSCVSYLVYNYIRPLEDDGYWN